MTRTIVEQPITVSNDRGTTTTHPAFAQIGASRVSGGHVSLYGSDFSHNHYMTVSIHVSELNRSLNRDWHFGRQKIIEVAMSEAQWATFVSAPNVGSGVPCTLNHIQGKRVPALPDPVPPQRLFDAEMKAHLEDTLKIIQDAADAVAGLGVSKTKAEMIMGALRRVHMELSANLPFVVSQFGEHMETVVEKAKDEVHGYMVHALQRAGMEALAAGALPLQIERGDADNKRGMGE